MQVVKRTPNNDFGVFLQQPFWASDIKRMEMAFARFCFSPTYLFKWLQNGKGLTKKKKKMYIDKKDID